jgi:hypothetical protein
VTETSRKIADAVDNEEWQEFRLSLKGISTQEKLDKLRVYWEEYARHESPDDPENMLLPEKNDIRERAWRFVRVDNYLKALARGGQLFPGVSLQDAVKCNWKLSIKS